MFASYTTLKTRGLIFENRYSFQVKSTGMSSNARNTAFAIVVQINSFENTVMLRFFSRDVYRRKWEILNDMKELVEVSEHNYTTRESTIERNQSHSTPYFISSSLATVVVFFSEQLSSSG